MIGTHVNITDRKKTELALKHSLKTAENLIQAIPSGLFIFQYKSPDELILIDANPEAEHITGIIKDVWRNHEFNEIWPQAREQSYNFV